MRYILILFFCKIFLISCKSTYNPKHTWTKALSQCASDDLLAKTNKKRVLFLGLSNSIGPGSGWRFDSVNKVLENRWAFEKAIPDSKERESMFNPNGINPSCNVSFEITNKSEIKAQFNSDTLKLNGLAQIDLNKAKKMVINFKKWRKENIDEVAYEDWIHSSFKKGNKYSKDLLIPNRLVMKSAIWVQGFEATIKIESSVLDSLNTKFDLNKIANIEGNLSFKRTAKDEVKIESNDGFYVIGTFVTIRDGSLGMMTNNTQVQILNSNENQFSENVLVKKNIKDKM